MDKVITHAQIKAAVEQAYQDSKNITACSMVEPVGDSWGKWGAIINNIKDLCIFTKSVAVYIAAAALCGLGNGIAQPIFYTKAIEVVTSDSKSTLSLAYLQVANYVAISMVPVIIGAGQKVFHTSSTIFPFIFVGVATAIVLFFVVVRNRHFVFGMSKNYYE